MVLLALAGCSGQVGAEPQAKSGELTVFAASSLSGAFPRLGAEFEGSHPGTRVRFNFAGSSTLVAQLSEGAPADLFASAAEATMDKAVKARVVDGTPQLFATNSMVVVVAPGNPEEVADFAGLTSPGVRVVVCAPQVPCGAATERVEQVTGVTLHPVSEESSAVEVLGKVASGQADAGVVYRTDALGAQGRVTGIAIPPEDNAETAYSSAVVAGSRRPELAGEFQSLVVSAEGQRILAEAGFGTR